MNPVGSLVGVAVTLVSATLLLSVMPGQQLGRDDHKQLDWKGAGGCVVEFVHTPCRTVRYHEYSFGSSLGFDRSALPRQSKLRTTQVRNPKQRLENGVVGGSFPALEQCSR